MRVQPEASGNGRLRPTGQLISDDPKPPSHYTFQSLLT